MKKPIAHSCERNQAVIYDSLKNWLTADDKILEIGSGTGQHGVYFSERMPDITWQYSDQAEYLEGIKLWLADYQGTNLLAPFTLDANSYHWLDSKKYNAVFTANTLHIMSWKTVQIFLNNVKHALHPHGKLIIYGPFRYNSQFTTDSNAAFDKTLKQRDAAMGIRDFEAIAKILQQHGFTLIHNQTMPANNQMLLWQLK